VKATITRVRPEIGVEQRRARLALRHHLAPSALATDAVQAARDLVALHGTDPASVFLAAWARTRTADAGGLERALYEERSLLRILGMRRTMFVVPAELAPVVQAACTRAIANQERRKLVQIFDQAGVAENSASWLEEVEEATLRALAARGQATGAELSADEPRLRQQILLSAGKRYEALVNVTTRVLFLLGADGRIIRGRPRGSWISSQYAWSPIEFWLEGGLAELDTETARTELVRRWLGAFGPGTAADIRWWTGWTAAELRRALANLATAEVGLDGETGLVLADDQDPLPVPDPWAALLPALDPTVMGWAGRSWFLGPHGPALFDRSGNPGPTVWWEGHIVGGWAQRRDGEIAFRLLEDVGTDALRAIEEVAEELRGWLGKLRVTPRFRTPLERELVG
jgi:Winged helix DNA-binding domain